MFRRRATYKLASHALDSPYNRTKFSVMLQTCMTITIPLSNLSKNEKHIVFGYVLHRQHVTQPPPDPRHFWQYRIALWDIEEDASVLRLFWDRYESINRRHRGFPDEIRNTSFHSAILIGCSVNTKYEIRCDVRKTPRVVYL